jgi:16S rRNA (cytidine1402-2'-O)-methyltransferase
MSITRNKFHKESPPSAIGKGILYVVATPIGNLEDITLRALRILKEVDLIAAEDTRHTRKLLSHFGITTPTLSYYKEKERKRAAIIIKKLHEGLNVALVSDAGTPGISDPGSILVQFAVAENIRVEPIPGPSSLTAALSVAGFTELSFVFLGFAPSRQKQRRDLLQSLATEKKNLIFFEAPHRVDKFLNDCHEILGDRPIFWSRELTKMHEELTHSSLSALSHFIKEKKIKGESVFLIKGAAKEPSLSEKEIEQKLKEYKIAGESSLKDAVKAVSAEYNLSRTAVYNHALKIWKT